MKIVLLMAGSFSSIVEFPRVARRKSQCIPTVSLLMPSMETILQIKNSHNYLIILAQRTGNHGTHLLASDLRVGWRPPRVNKKKSMHSNCKFVDAFPWKQFFKSRTHKIIWLLAQRTDNHRTRLLASNNKADDQHLWALHLRGQQEG